MHSLFDLIYDHQRLSAQQRAGEPLQVGEQALLVGLAQLLGGVRAESRHALSAPHVEVPGNVRVAVGGKFHVAHVKNVSGAGLDARMRVAPTVGTAVLVEIEDPMVDVRYAFPAVVTGSSRGISQLSFDGAPTRGRLAEGTRRFGAATLQVQATTGPTGVSRASATASAA